MCPNCAQELSQRIPGESIRHLQKLKLPIPRATLELAFEPPTDGPTEMTFEFQTDANGELVFLGDPLKYKPQVLDKPWLRIRTEPLF